MSNFSNLLILLTIFICFFFLSLQIRDWLTVHEEMLRQQAVVVGDVDEILQLLEKQRVSKFKNRPKLTLHQRSTLSTVNLFSRPLPSPRMLNFRLTDEAIDL